MPEIIQQVGNLMLGAVPTALLFIVLVLAYHFLVQGPLTATLAERRARTEGAVEEAHKAIAKAEARAAEYDAKLRQARAEAFKVREQRVKQRNAERDAALDAALASALAIALCASSTAPSVRARRSASVAVNGPCTRK
jgi:F-type H+-transporting ATPase subunit b